VWGGGKNQGAPTNLKLELRKVTHKKGGKIKRVRWVKGGKKVREKKTGKKKKKKGRLEKKVDGREPVAHFSESFLRKEKDFQSGKTGKGAEKKKEKFCQGATFSSLRKNPSSGWEEESKKTRQLARDGGKGKGGGVNGNSGEKNRINTQAGGQEKARGRPVPPVKDTHSNRGKDTSTRRRGRGKSEKRAPTPLSCVHQRKQQKNQNN